MTDSSTHTRQFRDALGSFATGVTVVTTRDSDGRDIGLTANSFNSVSLDPPMVLWSLSKASASLSAFQAAKHFAIHILASDHQQLSATFAKRGADKFAGLPLKRGHDGTPLLDGCSACFECQTEFQYEGGDHMIFVGRVIRFDHFNRTPLLFHGGEYAMAVSKAPGGPLDVGEPDSSFSQDFLIYLVGRAHYQLFLELRKDLERRGLSEDQWFVLSILGVSDHREVHELDRLLAYAGKRVTYDLVAALAVAELVQIDGPYDPDVRVSLTEVGRHTVIELVAIAKAAESHAERNLEADESRLLKRLLKTVIRDTNPGPAPLGPPLSPLSED